MKTSESGFGRMTFVLGGLVLAAAAVGLSMYFAGRARPEAGAAGDGKAGETVTLASNQGGGRAAGEPAEAKKDEKKKKNGKEEEKKDPVPVSVSAIATGPVSSYVTSTANLVPENEVKVLAEAEGRVAELLVEEGDRVGRSEVLASLVKDDAQIALRKAEIREANARLAHERAVKVADQELMSREAFDKVALDKEIAAQELAEARWRLEKTTIKAPFGGRITERMVKPGQHVRPGDILFTVSDFDPLIARIYLPERDVLGLKEGRDVRITLKADEQIRFRGRIRQISPVVDTATGTVKVTVEAVAPPPVVRPGAFITIDIVRETREKVVLVPREAVVRELQDTFIFVAKGDVAEKRAVALGLEEAGHIEAVSGVQAGEQVIVAGQGGLKNGTLIKVVETVEASGLVARRELPGRA